MGLRRLVEDLGCDPGPIFAGDGFQPGQFTDPDAEIGFVAASRLLARCVEATGCGHLGLLLGERANPSSLRIAGPMFRVAPDVRTALRDLVRHLDLHDRGAVAFQTRWMDHPVSGADPLLYRHFAREADELHAVQPTGLVYQLRRLLRRSFVVGRAESPVIARQLGMHVRTLNRRLGEEGTSFRQELEDIRYEVARQLLADTNLPLAKIGAALGYADSTAFIRAFKRWSKTPPAEWRRLHRQSRGADSRSPTETRRGLRSLVR